MNETDWLCRTELLVTKKGLERLKQSKVLIVGLGGVGANAAEQICRAGIENLTLIDNDIVQPSNINRQIIALQTTIGKPKTEVIAERLKSINPNLKLSLKNIFVDSLNVDEILSEGFDYVVDAIDTLTPKVDLLEACIKHRLNVVSSMGSGARLDPTKIAVADIRKTNHCRLAYMVRKYLHRRGIFEGITAVYSTEPVPKHALIETDGAHNKRTVVGTISYLPSIFGAFCASVVIRSIIENTEPTGVSSSAGKG